MNETSTLMKLDGSFKSAVMDYITEPLELAAADRIYRPGKVLQRFAK